MTEDNGTDKRGGTLTDKRIVGLGGHEFVFSREEPQYPQRRVGTRRVVADWVHQFEADETWSRAVVHEHDDGMFEPTSLYGVFADFPGATAVEITIRWMQRTHAAQMRKARTQRLVMAGACTVLAMLAILAWTLR
jgi:hypothetical protein